MYMYIYIYIHIHISAGPFRGHQAAKNFVAVCSLLVIGILQSAVCFVSLICSLVF